MQKWRRFIRMVFVDACDTTWCYALRFGLDDHAEKDSRFFEWRFMTQMSK